MGRGAGRWSGLYATTCSASSKRPPVLSKPLETFPGQDGKIPESGTITSDRKLSRPFGILFRGGEEVGVEFFLLVPGLSVAAHPFEGPSSSPPLVRRGLPLLSSKNAIHHRRLRARTDVDTGRIINRVRNNVFRKTDDGRV